MNCYGVMMYHLSGHNIFDWQQPLNTINDNVVILCVVTTKVSNVYLAGVGLGGGGGVKAEK